MKYISLHSRVQLTAKSTAQTCDSIPPPKQAFPSQSTRKLAIEGGVRLILSLPYRPISSVPNTHFQKSRRYTLPLPPTQNQPNHTHTYKYTRLPILEATRASMAPGARNAYLCAWVVWSDERMGEGVGEWRKISFLSLLAPLPFLAHSRIALFT
jgi:hypothetical protein